MAAPPEIVRLVETFERNKEAYRQGGLNETQLRREFLDPFFKALGWDVDNTQGWAERYKEVIHEDAIRIESSVKAPDYCFRIGGTRKFFVEAKAPSVNLKEAAEPAYQVRRYAWSAKLPLSILTDFEEFAVYDCRVRPNKADKPSKARVMYLTYTDYTERWEEIASIFSRDAVLQGSFDKYAVTEKRKHGTAEVDVAFLAEIESWRDALAHNIATRNLGLSNRQLNYAVQITIDRIIFLRICEDRGIERYGELMALLNGQDVYGRMMGLFRKADDRYNSGLFHFQPEKDRPEGPDELTPELAIDDKPLKDIVHSLYYPDSPYEFSVLPAEILGQVYEQFLGKVITLTAGHHARVEDKPEVKKAGGVFYTPAYIVDYIVKQTVGKLLEGCSVKLLKTKPPKLDRPLRVLDPACGSGSFLLGAYQLLLDWYRDYYANNEPDKWAKTKHPPIYQCPRTGWRLTITERKRILLDHIYGVDIDTQAVEVTKLSLLLKVLEGEKSLVLFHHERALPDLASNIKCGNSLIAPDFYKDQQLMMFDEEERYRINAFDWQAEFPQVFQDNGFDAVIGNPPYLYSAGQEHRDYFASHFSLSEYQADFYVYFLEKALDVIRESGYLGMIVSDSWLKGKYFCRLRQYLLQEAALQTVVVFDYPPFVGAAIENSILVLTKMRSQGNFSVERFSGPGALHPLNELDPQQCLSRGILDVRSNPEVDRVLAKIERGAQSLCRFCRLNRGVHAYRTDGYGRSKFRSGPQTKRDKDEKVYHAKSRVDSTYLPELKGKHLRRYDYVWDGTFISYGDWLAEPRSPEFFMQPKLAIRKIIAPKLICTWLSDPIVLDQSIYVAIAESEHSTNLLYLLGVLTSSMGGWYLRRKYSIYDTLYPWFTKEQLSKFPIRPFDFSNSGDKTRHDRMVGLVEGMLHLHKELAGAKTPNEKETIQRQIAATDEQIDQLVYELYGLTADEIRIVEGATLG